MLSNLAANNHTNQAVIAASNGIPPLVRLLGSGNAGVQGRAARALWNLADNYHANRTAIAASGTLVPLVRLLGNGSTGMQAGAVRAAIRDLVLAAVETREVSVVDELLDSGLLQELIDDPTGALVQAAVGPGVADAPSMVELLLRHGVPVTLPAVNAAVWRLNDEALKALLVAGRPPVLLGSEEGPEHWRGAGEQCPLYNLLTCKIDYPGSRARTAEPLLAAGYRPAIYHHLVFSWWREGGWGLEEEVVEHLHDFCPVEDLVAAQPALRARLRGADRWVQ